MKNKDVSKLSTPSSLSEKGRPEISEHLNRLVAIDEAERRVWFLFENLKV